MPSILLVEDDADIRMVMEDALKEEGFQIVQAANGLEALEKLRELELPRVILLDWNMPIMNGQEFLAAIGKNEAFSKIPVVIISASTYLKTKIPDHDFLAKPIGIEELFQVVRKYIA